MPFLPNLHEMGITYDVLLKSDGQRRLQGVAVGL